MKSTSNCPRAHGGVSRRSLLKRSLPGLGIGLWAAACLALGERRAPPATSDAGKLARGSQLTLMAKDSYTEPQWAGSVQPALARWQEQTGITIEHIITQGSGTPFNDKLQVLVAAGTPPDLFSIGGSQDPLGLMLRADGILPLDPLVRRDRFDTADYYPYALAHFRRRNILWGLPQLTNPVVMFHNRDLLARAGLQPPPANWKAAPWDWDELLAAAQAMTRPSEDPTQTIFGAAITDSEFKTAMLSIWSRGGDLFDREHTRSTLDTPPAIEALEWLVGLIHKHRVNPSPSQLQGTNLRAMFGAGRIGLLGSGQALMFAGRLEQDRPGFPWGIHVFPRGRAGRPVLSVGGAYAIAKGSRLIEEAWALLKFVSSAEFLRLVAGNGRGGISPRKSVMAEVVKAPDLPVGYKEAIDLGDDVRRWPLLVRWAEIADVFLKQMPRLWRGEVAVRTFVADLSAQINPLLMERF